ncbi:hypothetical protein AKJ16_DCAP04600 [Drosera capensis]
MTLEQENVKHLFSHRLLRTQKQHSSPASSASPPIPISIFSILSRFFQIGGSGRFHKRWQDSPATPLVSTPLEIWYAQATLDQELLILLSVLQ